MDRIQISGPFFILLMEKETIRPKIWFKNKLKNINLVYQHTFKPATHPLVNSIGGHFMLIFGFFDGWCFFKAWFNLHRLTYLNATGLTKFDKIWWMIIGFCVPDWCRFSENLADYERILQIVHLTHVKKRKSKIIVDWCRLFKDYLITLPIKFFCKVS